MSDEPNPIAVDAFSYWLQGFAQGINGSSIDGPYVANELYNCLTDCGYALVKLPEPDETNGHFVRFGDHWVDKRDGTITWHHHKVHGDLRSMALECLAAANAADTADGA